MWPTPTILPHQLAISLKPAMPAHPQSLCLTRTDSLSTPCLTLSDIAPPPFIRQTQGALQNNPSAELYYSFPEVRYRPRMPARPRPIPAPRIVGKDRQGPASRCQGLLPPPPLDQRQAAPRVPPGRCPALPQSPVAWAARRLSQGSSRCLYPEHLGYFSLWDCMIRLAPGS